jgi:hypothetical protein
MTSDQVELRLELDPTSDPIQGRLHDGLGNTVSFAGWMRLMAAIEAGRQLRLETFSNAME